MFYVNCKADGWPCQTRHFRTKEKMREWIDKIEPLSYWSVISFGYSG